MFFERLLPIKKVPNLRVSMLLLFVAIGLTAQVPSTFQVPSLGYVLDSGNRLHPVIGIPGNSRIDAPVELGFAITQAAILPDHKHIIVRSDDLSELAIVNLGNRSVTAPITGAPPNLSSMRTSGNGAAAALHDEARKRIFIVGGLPDLPEVRDIIDLSFLNQPVSRYAVSDDGAVTLLAFSDDEKDTLYTWTRKIGPRFVTTAARVSDIAFINNDAFVSDASAGQVMIIRGVREQAIPVIVADSDEGLSRPVAVTVSGRNEILVADAIAGAVITLDAGGRFMRSLPCGCVPSSLSPLRGSTWRLTDRLDVPVYLFDGSSEEGRILFIPALTESTD